MIKNPRIYEQIAALLVLATAALLLFRVFDMYYMLPINILMLSALMFAMTYRHVVNQTQAQAKRTLTFAIVLLVGAIFIFILGQVI